MSDTTTTDVEGGVSLVMAEEHVQPPAGEAAPLDADCAAAEPDPSPTEEQGTVGNKHSMYCTEAQDGELPSTPTRTPRVGTTAADLGQAAAAIDGPTMMASNTDSMVSIAFTDLSLPETPGPTETFSSKPTALGLSISHKDLPPLHTKRDSDVFIVPTLPSPHKTNRKKSQHVRAKSSLQEPDMAALLAKLEMENQAIAKDPKSGIAAVGAHTGPDAAFEYRVRGDVCSSLSLVHIPEDALGMSLGDFWALVTKDYNEALRLLPTMTPLMIHKGVPEILRSAVWVGMAGGFDASLQVEFQSLCDRLQYEKPQNEHIINKDLARCFPHHDFFRDADGEGQRMLGTLLKCYSLYDAEIGYCQGMAFVAGALLLNMPLKDAFCVFVKLMEKHKLRTLYSVDLTGLHARTFQLKKLMGQIAPELLEHLTEIGLEMSYLSQWFMSLFATSCPLNVLFRIYDVVFAEGADETVMRVALALIVSNEHKIMAMSELEDVLHLLLGRRLWEPYQSEPDFLMDEIARLSNVVTRPELDRFEQMFDEQSARGEKTAQSLGFAAGFGAFRLFEHFRTPSTSRPSVRLQPTTPLADVNGRRSTATTGAGSISESLMSSTDSQATTAATELDLGDRASIKTSKSGRNEDRGLHEQVEGLLLALSEVQREAAETAAQLQMENRRKESIAAVVGKLRDLIAQKEQINDTVKRERRKTMPSRKELDSARKTLGHLRKKSVVISEAAQTLSLSNMASSAPDVELQQSLQRLCCLLDSQSQKGTPTTDTGSFSARTPMTPLGISDLNARNSRHDSVRPDTDDKDTRRAFPPLTIPTAPAPQIVTIPQTPQSPEATTDYYTPFDEGENDYWPGAPPPHVYQSNSPSAFPNAALSPGLSAPHTPAPRQSSLQAREVLRASGVVPAADEAMLLELVNAKTREATAIHERDEMVSTLSRMRREINARETAVNEETVSLIHQTKMLAKREQAMLAEKEEMTRRMEDMHRGMEEMMAKLGDQERRIAESEERLQLQEQRHREELARLDGCAVVSRGPSRVPTPNGEEGLWPKSILVPTTPAQGSALEPPSAGAWGWFKKRSVSAGQS